MRDKQTLPDGLIIERVIWRLPVSEPERLHGFKYRLHCGRGHQCLVRYDNETGKDDHIHYAEVEKPYQFVSLDQLLADFETDVRRFAGV